MLTELIDLAKTQVGYKEQYSNLTKYGEAYGWNGVAWCVIFQWWLFNQLGRDDLFPKVAHCNQVESYAKEHGRWVTGDYQKGDLVIWDYDSNGERDHIGLVYAVSGSTLYTIEGNASDQVSQLMHNTVSIVGAYRPDYGEEQTPVDTEPGESKPIQNDTDYAETHLPIIVDGDVGTAVGAVQLLLEFAGYGTNSIKRNGKPDCEMGGNTMNALKLYQELNHISPCEYGTVGPETWMALIGGVD